MAKRQQKADTRERILAIAEQLFADRGYSDTSLNQIAQELNFSRQAVLYHFQDKDNLYREVIKQAYAHQDKIYLAIDREEFDTLKEYVDYLADAATDYHCQYPNFAKLASRLLLGESTNTGTSPLRPAATTAIKLWENVVKEGVKDGIFRDVPIPHLLALIGGTLNDYILIADSIPKVDNRLSYDPFSPENITHIKEILRRAIWAALKL